MANMSSILLVSAVVALVIGGATGYYARGSEVSTLQGDLSKARESKTMLEAELKSKTVSIQLNAEKGQMAHDLWLLIAPVAEGKYAVSLHAEGLESEGAYIVEGVTKTELMQTVPLAGNIPESEFIADENGNGLYWLVLDEDPLASFEKILILYLPNMEMDKAVLTATASLS